MDLQGRPIRLAALRGKAVWINYWASWCPPCQFETPTIRAIDQRYRDRGLVVVGIQVQQTVQAGLDYAERYDLEYTIGADVTGDFFHLYRAFALPTQFFLDPDGRIVRIVNGPMSEAAASELIESILPPGSSRQPSRVQPRRPSRDPQVWPATSAVTVEEGRLDVTFALQVDQPTGLEVDSRPRGAWRPPPTPGCGSAPTSTRGGSRH